MQADKSSGESNQNENQGRRSRNSRVVLALQPPLPFALSESLFAP